MHTNKCCVNMPAALIQLKGTRNNNVILFGFFVRKKYSSEIRSALRSTCDLLPEKLLIFGVLVSRLSTGHRLSTKNNFSFFI